MGELIVPGWMSGLFFSFSPSPRGVQLTLQIDLVDLNEANEFRLQFAAK